MSSIETQLNTTGFAPQMPAASGFMDPEKIVGYLGVTEGMRVADFGSGSGHFAVLLGKLVGENGKVTAIDLLDSSLETLRAKAKAEGLGNIETVRSNLAALGGSGLPNDSQDLVLLANTLFQNADKQPLIEEAKRVLKPGAALVVIEWRKGSGGFGPPDELRTDPESMKSIIADNGFQLAGELDAGVFHYGMIFRKV